jgi:hypothetical protein
MSTVEVTMRFQNSEYQIKGNELQIPKAMLRIIVKKVKARIVQREAAYKACQRYLQHEKSIFEIKRRLDYIRKQDLETGLAALIKLFPLIKSLTPPVRSAHYSSYHAFLHELHRWILNAYSHE